MITVIVRVQLEAFDSRTCCVILSLVIYYSPLIACRSPCYRPAIVAGVAYTCQRDDSLLIWLPHGRVCEFSDRVELAVINGKTLVVVTVHRYKKGFTVFSHRTRDEI